MNQSHNVAGDQGVVSVCSFTMVNTGKSALNHYRTIGEEQHRLINLSVRMTKNA